MSSRTYRSLSLANEVSRLENEWKSIKTNQVYSVSQFGVFRTYGDKVANQAWQKITSYDQNGENPKTVNAPVFNLKSADYRTLDGELAWTQWQIIFYDSDKMTEIDPTKLGCVCMNITNGGPEVSYIPMGENLAAQYEYVFNDVDNKTLYAQIMVVSSSKGVLDVEWSDNTSGWR